MPHRVLFISQLPLFPLTQGYRVHGVQAARALADAGCDVRLASIEPTHIASREPIAVWLTHRLERWPDAEPSQTASLHERWQPWTRRRVVQHQGLPAHLFVGLLPLVQRLRPDVVIALGQHGPALLSPLQLLANRPSSVWYAADDPVTFALSCARRDWPTRWPGRLRQMVVSGMLQRGFESAVDAVVGVSNTDTRRLSRFTQTPVAVTLPNGVDTEHFTPQPSLSNAKGRMERPITRLVFWGSLAFEPNDDAMNWFLRRVWPRLNSTDVQLDIIGTGATPKLDRLAQRPGVTLHGYVPDLVPAVRPDDAGLPIAIMPFRCGRGIKNKLLEAAAMGLPILASPRATHGLRAGDAPLPVTVCRTVGDWQRAIQRLQHSPHEAETLGARARAWVVAHHSWRHVARGLVDLMQQVNPVSDPAEVTYSPPQAA